jgi:hypothetical protein
MCKVPSDPWHVEEVAVRIVKERSRKKKKGEYKIRPYWFVQLSTEKGRGYFLLSGELYSLDKIACPLFWRLFMRN